MRLHPTSRQAVSLPFHGCVYLAGVRTESNRARREGRGCRRTGGEALSPREDSSGCRAGKGWPTAKMVMQSPAAAATAVLHESHFPVFTFRFSARLFSFCPGIWAERWREREREGRMKKRAKRTIVGGGGGGGSGGDGGGTGARPGKDKKARMHSGTSFIRSVAW